MRRPPRPEGRGSKSLSAIPEEYMGAALAALDPYPRGSPVGGTASGSPASGGKARSPKSPRGIAPRSSLRAQRAITPRQITRRLDSGHSGRTRKLRINARRRPSGGPGGHPRRTSEDKNCHAGRYPKARASGSSSKIHYCTRRREEGGRPYNNVTQLTSSSQNDRLRILPLYPRGTVSPYRGHLCKQPIGEAI